MADQQTPSTAIPIRVALVDTNGQIIGSLPVTIADNGDFALGSVADAQWSGSGNATAISLLKKIAAGGGGGSGPVTVIDGGDVTQGAKADAAWDGLAASATVVAILKKIAAGGGSAVSIADGSDVAEGLTTDAAVASDVGGTVSGKLRGLVKILADAWDSVNHRLNVALPAATVTTLTPPSNTGYALDASLTTIDADLKANITLHAGTNVIGHVVTDTGSTTAVTGNVEVTNDVGNPLPVSGTVSVSATVLPAGAATPTDGVVTNTVPGAPTQLPTVAAKLVAITASPQNVDDVVLGSATVSASRSARSGLPLGPGDSVTMPLTNLNDLYVDCRVPGDGVSYLVLA